MKENARDAASRLVGFATIFLFILLFPLTGLGQTVNSLVAQGKALRAEGKTRKAVDILAAVLERTPEHVESWIHLGAAYEDLGNWREAVTCYRRALKLDPDSAAAAHNLKQLHSFRAVNAPVKPVNPAGEHLIQIGLNALKSRDLERALEVFRLCRGLLKDDPRPLLYTADILERTGKRRNALALYERIVVAFPNFVPARVNYVIALLATGNRKAALKRAQESLEAFPGDTRLAYLVRLCSPDGPADASNKRVGTAFPENRAP
ncbi:MAG: tetratricopeptide repeat protein [Desulfomonilaceae bacterium]|nr:tetratricopeptide repeat protein [Desulfomonilaceae bacterium]